MKAHSGAKTPLHTQSATDGLIVGFYDCPAGTPTLISNVEFVGDLHIGHIGGALVFRRDGRVETTGNLKPDALAAVVIDIIKQQWPAAVAAPSATPPVDTKPAPCGRSAPQNPTTP